MKIILLVLFFLSINNLQAKGITGEVVKIRGEVKVLDKLLKLGDKVKQGDKLIVAPKSFAQVKFSDGSTFLIKEGILKLDKLKKNKTILSLIKGTLFNSVHKDNTKKYQVKTYNASMAVRGTKFYVMASKKESYLCVCEGSVEVKNRQDKLVVKKFEDAHIKLKSKIKKSSSPQVMWDMANEGFTLMQETIDSLPKK